ncbi:hypothetical protein [Mycobacterium servetii]|uniref:Uncharacterized protein n=1 Tax=Mycobacterium servetii TaxID=3237418 RepID=A0ABV4C6Z5_9MYCO
MARYTYRVVWSPTYQKYFARCLDIPTLTPLGTTQQDALEQVSRLAADSDEAAKASGYEGDTRRRTAPSVNLRHAQRVVPRWHTRC